MEFVCLFVVNKFLSVFSFLLKFFPNYNYIYVIFPSFHFPTRTFRTILGKFCQPGIYVHLFGDATHFRSGVHPRVQVLSTLTPPNIGEKTPRNNFCIKPWRVRTDAVVFREAADYTLRSFVISLLPFSCERSGDVIAEAGTAVACWRRW